MIISEKESEQRLISETLNGNSQSFKPLIERYWNLVCSVIQRYIKNRETVEDLCQEVFLLAYTRLELYKNEFSFSPWLVKIAINKSLEFLRKENRSPVVDYDLDFVSTLKFTPEVIIDEKAFFDDCLEGLPENFKVLFLLRHGVEFSYEEMAYVLDLPLGTVKGAMFRIRNHLKGYLEARNRSEEACCAGGQEIE